MVIMDEREIAHGMVNFVFDRKEAPGPVGQIDLQC
jgi:hypothetical protein